MNDSPVFAVVLVPALSRLRAKGEAGNKWLAIY